MANLEHDLLPGDKYGRLVVLGDRETEFIHRMVSVRCECGTEFTVRATNVRTGHTTECSVCRRKSAKKKALDSKAAALLAVYRMAMASGGEEAGHVMGFCHRKLIEKAAAAK